MVSYIRTSEDATLEKQVIRRGLLGALLAPLVGMLAGSILISGLLARGSDTPSNVVGVLGFAVVVLIYPVIFAYLPSLLVVVATYSLLLHRRCFGLVLYLLLGFVGGTLMIFPLGGVGMAQKGPAQFTFFLALFFGLPGMLSGWVFWLIAVRPLRDRLKRAASIPINP